MMLQLKGKSTKQNCKSVCGSIAALCWEMLFMPRMLHNIWLIPSNYDPCSIFVQIKKGKRKENSSEKIFSEKILLYSLRLSRTKGYFGFSLLFGIIVCVQHLFLRLYLRKQQQINGGQNHNSASFNLSPWTFFYTRLNKYTSTVPLHWEERRQMVFSCVFINIIFEYYSEATQIHWFTSGNKPFPLLFRLLIGQHVFALRLYCHSLTWPVSQNIRLDV